ncbi:beta-ketoacyl-[acyl-carrier-protein] synthase family protein [Candidatus Omnitrophota bacterium]
MKNVAITGIGVLTAAGIGKANFWRHIRHGQSFISPITRFDASRYPSRIAGQIKDLDAYSSISPRLLKKIDAFSHMSLVASELALKDAHIDLAQEDLDNVGIFAGNAIGGWLYAETELRDLYIEGREGVSPFMASAWFPAAPQGQVSIAYGIKGFSKTFVADRAGSLMAIAYGAKAVERRGLDIVLAGGMEAPVSPYALLCCNTNGSLSLNNDTPESAYRPFDKNRDGFVIGEGSGIVTLESQERAKGRDAKIHGFIRGFGTTCDGVSRIDPAIDGDELARAIRLAMEEAEFDLESIDYICADAAATKIGDISETNAIKKVFGKRAKSIPVSAPKAMYGNLLGASGSVDMISTLLAMEHGLIPPTINYKNSDPQCDLDYVPNKSQSKQINRALVISRGRGGINAVLALEKGEDKNE